MQQEKYAKCVDKIKIGTPCDLLATYQQIQNDAKKLSKDSTDYNTIENENIIQRILNVLDDGIEKIKYTLIMPYLLENPCELENYLSDYDLKRLYKYSEVYYENEKLMQTKSSIGIRILPIEISYQLSQAIDIIYSNQKIRENLTNYLNNIPIHKKTIIQALEDNRKNAEKRLKRSAITEIATDRIIHHIFHNNEKLNKKVEEQQTELGKKEISTKWNVISKQSVVQKYQEDLAFKKWENSIKVKKMVVRANVEMETICIAYDKEEKKLTQQVEKLSSIYDSILIDTTKQEKDLREQKNIYIDKLQKLVKKFDNNILAKISEHEKLVEEKLKEDKKTKEFMIEFYEQEKKYQTLYNTMLEEKHRAQREKMLMFMMNRAARTIQRYWRQFVKARKKKRGKGKGKGRGKKK